MTVPVDTAPADTAQIAARLTKARADRVAIEPFSADVLAATHSIAVGIEILDSRYRDYRFTMADVVADNTSAGRFVVEPAIPAAGLDLRLIGALLEHNGEVVAAAAGAAALGHPAAAVAWPVRSLATEDEGLRAGEIVLSGGLTAAVPLAAGDVVVATADRLGSVERSAATSRMN
jgi:2-keto-4-pentenoate hydratase